MKIDYVESEWQTAVTTRTFYSEVKVIYFVIVHCQHDSKRLKICIYFSLQLKMGSYIKCKSG